MKDCFTQFLVHCRSRIAIDGYRFLMAIWTSDKQTQNILKVMINVDLHGMRSAPYFDKNTYLPSSLFLLRLLKSTYSLIKETWIRFDIFFTINLTTLEHIHFSDHIFISVVNFQFFFTTKTLINTFHNTQATAQFAQY